MYFQDMLEALKALSGFFAENSLRSRRNLRSDIEKKSLGINEEFLSAFQAVKEVSELVFVCVFVRVYVAVCVCIHHMCAQCVCVCMLVVTVCVQV